VLSALIAQRLRAAGLSATSREGLGSNVDLRCAGVRRYRRLRRLFRHAVGQPVSPHRNQAARRIAQRIESDAGATEVTLLGELGFENAYALVMPRKRAEALGIRSIADLASHAKTMSMAADYEFFSRPEWAGLREAYGLSFRAQRQMQPDFMYAAAAASGEVDVIAGYTSDGLIAKYDLVVLEGSETRDTALRCDRPARRRSALPIRPCGRRYNRCSAASTSPRCARPICAPPAATARRRRMRWRAGCGGRSASSKATRKVASNRAGPFSAAFWLAWLGAARERLLPEPGVPAPARFRPSRSRSAGWPPLPAAGVQQLLLAQTDRLQAF